MSTGRGARPGAEELSTALRAAGVAVVGWFFADLFSGERAPVLLSLTFLLWLLTILAAARAVLALTIGLWRRSHA